jgi:transcriptional regulator with XRE-family HTH domain
VAEVSAIVKQARLAAGLTQSGLARRLGSSQAAVAKLERPGANPTIRTLERVMGAVGMRLDVRPVEHRSSVDETLIASYLRLTPAERLRAFQSSHESLARLRTAARAPG